MLQNENVLTTEQRRGRIPQWLSWIRIWQHHCCGSDYCHLRTWLVFNSCHLKTLVICDPVYSWLKYALCGGRRAVGQKEGLDQSEK